MKLNFTSLLYFQRTAEMQHLTNAAESLHVAQPALSRMISGIEKELGVALFERKGRNIKLTRDGEILLKHAKSFLAELDQLKTDLNESKNLQQMTVTLNIESAAPTDPRLSHEISSGTSGSHSGYPQSFSASSPFSRNGSDPFFKQ